MTYGFKIKSETYSMIHSSYGKCFHASATIADPRTSSSDWIKLNVGQFGYFRVNYEVEMWNALSQQLLNDHKVIDERQARYFGR